MSKKTRISRPRARLPKGMRDVGARELRAMRWMLERIRETFESYGFEPLATPAFEYTDALGKFLPDQDRPGEGVFSLQDDDEQWLSLRYDLTAPLARYVAQNFDALPKPFRRYQWGPVWRNEKPGPGRYREFVQFDADTVGTASVAADAEMCMLAADCLEALGIPRGHYVIKVNNRKVLDGVLESIGVDPHDTDHLGKRLTILRAIDKLDRLGPDAVRQLLGKGRKDESGDFTKGAGLGSEQIEQILFFVLRHKGSALLVEDYVGEAFEDETTFEADGRKWVDSNSEFLRRWEDRIGSSSIGQQGIAELQEMSSLFRAAGFGTKRIRIDPSVVRGLDYYTGPVYEAELTFEAENEEGQVARFGSVGGGGRYDHLIERFKGIAVPATGFSVGVSRLYAALEHLGRFGEAEATGPVVVLVMERERLSDYLRLAEELRAAGLRAEAYLGTSGMKAQMKYADRRGAPCVVIVGEDEREQDTVTIKDLIEGARLAAGIEGREQWREERPAQVSVPRGRMVEAVREILARYGA